MNQPSSRQKPGLRWGADWRRFVLCAVLSLFAPLTAQAETRWAIIVSGASGGEKYAEQMKQWRATLQTALVDRHGFDAAHVRMLVDETVTGGTTGSAANVKAVFSEIRKTAAKDDLVLLVLLGHGTFDGDVAKFNLVGPDLTANDWTDLLAGVQGRLIVVNTAGSELSVSRVADRKGRVVITATDSAAQKYATVFPEYFVKAMKEASTDLDKNGRTSIFEVFAGGERRGEAALRTARAADHRTRAARRQRRRQGP